MTIRKCSPHYMFEQMALQHEPRCRFSGKTEPDFSSWRAATFPKVLKTLGDFPEQVPPNPKLLAEWDEAGLFKQRWIIDLNKYLSGTVLINYPKGLRENEKCPSILCWHGHGIFGKNPVMGFNTSPAVEQDTAQHNYDYGVQMAQAGFITFAIDWIGCGEQNDSLKPNYKSNAGHRDWCNLYYLMATMLGLTSISINVSHARAATDFVCGLPHVAEDRLGVMGQSGGGVMTLWSALCDERFKAAEIICYSDCFKYFGFRDLNICGMQVAPGLFKLVDLGDLQGLLAPLPLLVDIGIYDETFYVEGAMECFQQVEKIYTAAEARDNLELDLFPGWHCWGGNKSKAFFKKQL